MSLTKRARKGTGFGPCHHMEEVLTKSRAGDTLASDRAAGRPAKWGRGVCGLSLAGDWPGAHVWRETAIAYPKAKVIYTTTRPEELWWQSFSSYS